LRIAFIAHHEILDIVSGRPGRKNEAVHERRIFMDCLLLWFYFMVLRFAVAAEHMNQFVFDDNLLLPQPTAWNYIFWQARSLLGNSPS